MNADIPPWNRTQWQRLTAPGAGMAHGLLFHGLPGLGKSALALNFAEHLVAAHAQGPEQARLLFRSGNHPDVHVLMPEAGVVQEPDALYSRYAQRYLDTEKRRGAKPRRVITVDQARAVMDEIFVRPYVADRRVIVILSAHALNASAVNAMLKVLEEPPPDTTLLLVSSRPHLLPATVRSRLVRFEFRVPPAQQALAWLHERLPRDVDAGLVLRLAHGAPLLALDLAQGEVPGQRDKFFAQLEALRGGRGDPLAMAESWQELGLDGAVAALNGVIADLARSAVSAQPPTLSHPDRSAWTARHGGGLDPIALFQFADRLAQARRFAEAPLDSRLQLEELAINLAALFGSAKAGNGRVL